MKFKTKKTQSYHRAKQDAIIYAELNYHDLGSYFVAEGKYYTLVDVINDDGEVLSQQEDWSEPIFRQFTREEAIALQKAAQVPTGATPMDGWDNLKIAASIYQLNATGGFGEWELVT